MSKDICQGRMSYYNHFTKFDWPNSGIDVQLFREDSDFTLDTLWELSTLVKEAIWVDDPWVAKTYLQGYNRLVSKEPDKDTSWIDPILQRASE